MEYAGMCTDASKICIGAFGMEAHAVEMRLRAVGTMVCAFGMEADAGGTNVGADGMGTQAGRMQADAGRSYPCQGKIALARVTQGG